MYVLTRQNPAPAPVSPALPRQTDSKVSQELLVVKSL